MNSAEPHHRLRSEFSDHESAARESARELTTEQLLSHDLNTLVSFIVGYHALEDAQVELGRTYLQTRLHGAVWAAAPTEEQHDIEMKFTAPCNYAASFMDPSDGVRVSGSDATSWNVRKSYWVNAAEYGDSTLASYQSRWIAEIDRRVEIHNQWVADHRTRMKREVESLIQILQASTQRIRKDAEKLEIPLSASPSSISIPILPKTLRLLEVDSRFRSGEPLYKLADEIADQLVETLRSFGSALERQHQVSSRMLSEDEESLRDILLFILNAQWHGQVTGETFVGNGKTDLLLRYKDRNAFIGECKIWRGAGSFSEAIDQLLGYTVWSDTRAGLILFVRGISDVQGIIAKAETCITDHPNYTGASGDGFNLRSLQDKERHIRISLIPIHIAEALE